MRPLHFGRHIRRVNPVKATVWTMVKRLIVITYGFCIRVKVRGNSRLIAPLKHGFIVAANHLNGADSFVLQVALRTRLFFVVSRKWFTGRFSRFIMRHICDAIPAETGDALGSVSGLRHCMNKLRAGGSLAIYPEGVFNRTGAPAEFQDGTAYLAIRTGTPILPVYIRNLRLQTEVASANRPIECWTGFLSVVENLFNVGIELVIGDPIEPKNVPTGQPDRLRAEVARINNEMEREFAQLASSSGSMLAGCQLERTRATGPSTASAGLSAGPGCAETRSLPGPCRSRHPDDPV